MRKLFLCLLVFGLAVIFISCRQSKVEKLKVNLSTPESTVISFTKAASTGKAELAQSCFLPGGVDYEDIKKALTAEPSSQLYPARVMMEAVDEKEPITVVSKKKTPYGLEVVWQVTFKNSFTIEGHTVHPGDTYNFDATLKKSGNYWLIDNF
ncbi:MAG: hypothetical protein ACYS0I_04345 [Planctomycetota bacterium]|jgi:hypothetical protein